MGTLDRVEKEAWGVVRQLQVQVVVAAVKVVVGVAGVVLASTERGPAVQPTGMVALEARMELPRVVGYTEAVVGITLRSRAAAVQSASSGAPVGPSLLRIQEICK